MASRSRLWSVITSVVFAFFALLGLALVFDTGGFPIGGFLLAAIFLVGLIGVWTHRPTLSRIVWFSPIPAVFICLAVIAEVGYGISGIDYVLIAMVVAIVAVAIWINEHRIRIDRDGAASASLIMNRGAAADDDRQLVTTPAVSPLGQRLQNLDKLRAEGVITDGEYQQRRERLLDEV